MPGLDVYRHFKGNEYLLLGAAIHSETGEKMALYASSATGETFARPWDEFFGVLPSGGLRFAKVCGNDE